MDLDGLIPIEPEPEVRPPLKGPPPFVGSPLPPEQDPRENWYLRNQYSGISIETEKTVIELVCSVINLGGVEPYFTVGVGMEYNRRINHLEAQYKTRIDHHGNVVRIRDSNPRGRDGINQRHNRNITENIDRVKKRRNRFDFRMLVIGWALDFTGDLCGGAEPLEAAKHSTGRAISAAIGGKIGGFLGAILGPMLYDGIHNHDGTPSLTPEQQEIRREGHQTPR